MKSKSSDEDDRTCDSSGATANQQQRYQLEDLISQYAGFLKISKLLLERLDLLLSNGTSNRSSRK